MNGDIVRPRRISDSQGTETAGESSTTGTAPTSQITEDEWDTVNNQAHHMLNTAVDHTILHNIASTKTAAGAWKILKDLYDRETVNTTITLLKTILDHRGL